MEDRGIKKLQRLKYAFNETTSQFPNVAYIRAVTLGECLDDLYPHVGSIPAFGDIRILGMRILLTTDSEFVAYEDEPMRVSSPPPQEASALSFEEWWNATIYKSSTCKVSNPKRVAELAWNAALASREGEKAK